ncbi:MAG: SDR family NAD(P)-dependent oxidoreductase [Planctomycetota bacterium]
MSTENKTAVVTGSTGGLGQEVCERLAQQGWGLVLVNRNHEKGEAQAEAFRKSSPGQAYRCYTANLLDPQQVVDVSREIADDHPALSALYNVAGLLTDRPTQSARGVEGHFVVNTLAPFLFTQGLRSSLAGGATSDRPSVVVNFSSSAVNSVKKLDFARLADASNPGGLMGAYAQTKMALTVATAQASSELSGEGVLAVCVDPGATKTPMTSGSDGMPWFVRLIRPLVFKSPAAQAEKLLRGVSSAVRENKPGAFIVEGRIKPMPALATDPSVQAGLRALLEELAEPYLSAAPGP